MADTDLGAARFFASHYQIVVCDDPTRPLANEENWDDPGVRQGFAGVPEFRMIGTEADLNDHWIELCKSDTPPSLETWQRVTCVHFRCSTGRVHVMSVIDNGPAISATIEKGDYAVYVAGLNLGIDQPRQEGRSEEGSGSLKTSEWYRIFLVAGVPARVGRLKDEP